MYKQALTATLGMFAGLGFFLEEEAHDSLILYHWHDAENYMVEHFTQHAAVDEIRRACENHMIMQHGLTFGGSNAHNN